MRILAGILVSGLSLLLLGSAAGQEDLPAGPAYGEETASEAGVFRGEVEVSVVTVFATVVDKNGIAVSGLTAADFAVFEGGKEHEITLFEAIDRAVVEMTTDDLQPDAEAETDPAPPVGSDSVAVVFDNVRLERRARRRVLKSLTEMIEPLREQGAEIMVGVVGPRFRVIQNFDNDSVLFAAALDEVGDTPTTGGALKSERRALKRDVYRGLATANAQNASIMAQSEGQRLQIRIDAYRELEMQRGLEGLNRLESLVRSLAGRGGRTSMIWVTEDMSFRPATDIYRRFYNRFSPFMALDLPETWGLERDLVREYDRVIGAAHAAGVTVHVVDASDRDSEAMDTDFGTQDPFTAVASQAVGPSTRGYDFSEVTDAVEGARYLGFGSGGGFFGNSRNFDVFVDSFVETTSTYYVIGYNRPAPSDGQAHSIKLEVKRPGLQVRYPTKVLDRTPEQRLTDAVVSHLVWNDGGNPLGLTVGVEARQTTEKGPVTWPVNLEIPAAGLLPGDDGRAPVTVVMCVGSSNGTLAEPQQFRLVLPVPKDNPLVVGTARVMLETRPDADRVAVGIRDENSGATSTVIEALAPG